MVHLHRHSEWSLLDGLGTAEQYAERAAEIGQFALALTDHGTLSGTLHHMEACQKAGVFPILGVEAYYRDDRTIHTQENKTAYHMTLLAKNARGWRSLMRLTSEANDSGFYHRPCVDQLLLEEHAEDLICLSSCLSGYVPKAMMASDMAAVKYYMKWMRGVFGDDYYVELMPHDIDELRQLNPMLVNWANEIGAPCVATIDTHYPYQEWSSTQEVAMLIGRNSSFEKREKEKAAGKEHYDQLHTLWLMDEQEVKDTFAQYHPDLPEDVVARAIKATDELALQVMEGPVVLSTHDKIPKISSSPEMAIDDLMAWCEEGMERIDKVHDKQYRERLDYELGVINDLGITDYFLLVGDIVRWSVAHDIFVEARGSVAGSLVAYLTQISSIDPIAYDLLFERFINPDRKGLPDIDLDFEHERRDEVKAYVSEQYGHDHVADIVAYQTFGARSTLQSIGRAYSIDFAKMTAITKTVPDQFDGTLEQLANINEDVARFSMDFPEPWEHACRLQGQVKARSKHAAAVAITDQPIRVYCPLERSKDGSLVTAWDDSNEQISKYGILKVDMLGVKGLTKWHMALDMIEERTGERPDLQALAAADPRDVEPEVMELFAKGLTLGIWQFESRGITGAVRKIRPDDVLDLSAVSALYRPGPIELLDEFTKKKLGKAPITYWHEDVEPFMSETYSVMVYQEQIMKIVQALGGLTPGDADSFRKAIGKLYRLKGNAAQEFMQTFYEQWMKGCEERGLTSPQADDIWQKILPFGNYAFNKSHSATYSRRSYVDAWLNLHYSTEYYASLLSYPPSDPTKKKNQQKQVIREAMVFNVKVLPPDINESKLGFTVTGEGIRFGLLAIKQVGDVAVREILDKQPFSSHEDFEDRIVKKKCNKTVKTALLNAGAFDCWGARDEVAPEVRSALEQEMLGIALTGSQAAPDQIEMIAANVHSEAEIDEMGPGSGVIMGGDVDNFREIDTKRGQMAFIDLVFQANRWNVTVFNDEWVAHKDAVLSGKPIMVQGRVDDKGRIVANTIDLVENVLEATR